MWEAGRDICRDGTFAGTGRFSSRIYVRMFLLQSLRLGIEPASLDLWTNALPTELHAEAVVVSLGASSVYIYIYISCNAGEV